VIVDRDIKDIKQGLQEPLCAYADQGGRRLDLFPQFRDEVRMVHVSTGWHDYTYPGLTGYIVEVVEQWDAQEWPAIGGAETFQEAPSKHSRPPVKGRRGTAGCVTDMGHLDVGSMCHSLQNGPNEKGADVVIV